MGLTRITIEPQSYFHTPLKGDTLFGQLCWTIRHQLGEVALNDLLQGYTHGEPFAVLSDALPAGFLPRPAVPAAMLGFTTESPRSRKLAKTLQWLPWQKCEQPLGDWHLSLQALTEKPVRSQVRTHNSLNRLTFTTGKGAGFAPYDRTETWYRPGFQLQIWLWSDDRLESEMIVKLLSILGQTGFGKEASSGAGKFQVTGAELIERQVDGFRHFLSLGPCAPQGLKWYTQESYYTTFVRFGRHGDTAVHSGKPFKNPVLMADTGALLCPMIPQAKPVIGQGLGGVSVALPETVHQGYAIALGVNV